MISGYRSAFGETYVWRTELKEWLGDRDSNPDNVVQSHVSYR